MSGESDDKLFCDIAIDLGYVTPEQVQEALQAQKVDAAVGQRRPPGAYFFDNGVMTKDQIGQVVKMQERVATSQNASQAAPLAHQHPGGYAPAPAQGAQAASYSAPQPTTVPLSRVAYILLGLFLGCLGIHNFAAGYTGRGVAQLLITLTLGWVFGLGIFITALWALIEIIAVTQDATGRPFS